MALQQQTKAVRLTGRTRDYGDPPMLPKSIAARFPEDVATYEAQVSKWWSDIKGHLREIDGELEAIRSTSNKLGDEVKALRAEFTDLQQ